MIERSQTFGQLMKSMKSMGGNIAPKSATLFTMLGQRLQRLEEEVAHVSEKCELKKESFGLVHDAETRLGAILNDLRNSNFLRTGDIREIVKEELGDPMFESCIEHIREIVKNELDKADFALNVDWKERIEIFLTGMIGGITAFIGMAVIYG